MAKPEAREEAPTPTSVGPLDEAAKEAMQWMIADLGDALLHEAKRLAGNQPISEIELKEAHARLRYPTKDSLTFADAQAIICVARVGRVSQLA